MNLKQWIISLINDEQGAVSSKRLVGLIASFTLCIVLLYLTFTKTTITLSDALINAVSLLAFGALGLSSLDKFTTAKNALKDAIYPEDKPIEHAEEII
jgi:hypothetical protein